jgi:selenocysteine-specific elongation factor
VLSVEVGTAHDAARGLRHRSRYRLHIGTAEVMCTLTLLEANELGPGGSSLGQLFLAEPVAAVQAQPFVLRQESPAATLGGGRVLQPDARRIRRRDQSELARLARLRSADPVERLAAVLAFQGLKPFDDRMLCRASGLDVIEVPRALERLRDSGAVVELPLGPRRTVRLMAEVVTELEDRVLRALRRLHAARPRQSAVPRSHVAAALPDIDNDALVATIIERLAARGRVARDARTVALCDHEPRLSQAERRLKAELAAAIRAGGISPPEASELAASAGPRAAIVAELLVLLRDEEQLVEIGSGLFLDHDVEADLRRVVVERLAGGARITMAELRDLLGTTRKFAVPIGEYLDRIGLTVREGDTRQLGMTSDPREVPAPTGPSPNCRREPEPAPRGSS